MGVPRREDKPQFMQLLRFLDDHGGVYQRHQPLFAEDLGWTLAALLAYVNRAVDLGVIKITSTTTYGKGRSPNAYTLLMSPEAWLARKPAIVDAKKAKLRERDKRAKKRRSEARAALLAAMADDPLSPIRAFEDELAGKAIAAALPVAVPEAPPEIDVDAWID